MAAVRLRLIQLELSVDQTYLRNKLQEEVRFKAVRSRGPGGQNVNRVSSAAIAYWEYQRSHFLTEPQKERLRHRLRFIINAENVVYMRSDEFRDLERNKSRCIEKLARAVEEGLHIPKARKKTKPTHSSKLKRREKKLRQGEKKKFRKKIEY